METQIEISALVEVEMQTQVCDKTGILHINKSRMGTTIGWKETSDLTDCLLYEINRIKNFYEDEDSPLFQPIEEQSIRDIHTITENSFICDWHEKMLNRTIRYVHTFYRNVKKSDAESMISYKLDSKKNTIFWEIAGFGSDTVARMEMMIRSEENVN